MKRILVPTDFSAASEKAFEYAVNIALKSNASIILYHIYTPLVSTFIGTEEKRREYNMEIEKNTLKRLIQLKNKVAGTTPGISISTIVGRSGLINRILQFAKDNKIDLIVMGTHGATGLKKAVIGSVAARTTKNSDVPVLLIPANLELKEPKKFVFAANYSKTDDKALSLTIELARPYNADITIAHLCAEPRESENGEVERFVEYAEQLQKNIGHVHLTFKYISTNSVASTMENLDKEIPLDVLVMVKRDKTFLQQLSDESFTQNMAYAAKFPLLVVPPQEREDKKQILNPAKAKEYLRY